MSFQNDVYMNSLYLHFHFHLSPPDTFWGKYDPRKLPGYDVPVNWEGSPLALNHGLKYIAVRISWLVSL